MGLKGYRLWVMGRLDSNVQRPTAGLITARHSGHVRSRSNHSLTHSKL
jgi:hypothetical protein